jgi:hypothetical protein
MCRSATAVVAVSVGVRLETRAGVVTDEAERNG